MTLLTFDKVYKDFTDGPNTIHALRPTNVELKSKELVSIIGPSGSGKSTLLTLMGGLQKPSGGVIYFGEKDLSALSEKERTAIRFRDVGFILQSSNLVPFLTVEDQLKIVDKFSGKKYRREDAHRLLQEMGIYERRHLYPSELSGGQKQRAAICRALYPQPKIILADEPTANLDTENAFKVVELLSNQSHKNNQTTVMVTHDVRLLEYSDRVFEITDGAMKEQQ